jgi:two-component system CheB/CheR fusion protein
MAERVFNLIAGDVGRPLADIKPNLNLPDLATLIVEAIDTVTVKDREVQDAEGHSYVLRIRPYKSLENRIDGAVLILLDYDGGRSAVDSSQRTDGQLSALAEIAGVPMLILDRNLELKKANRLFLERFGAASTPVEGKSLTELDGWNREMLFAVTRQCLNEGEVKGLEIEYEEDGSHPVKLRVNGRRIGSNNESTCLLVFTFEKEGRDGEGGV